VVEYPNETPFNDIDPAPAPRGYEGRGRPRFHALPGTSPSPASLHDDLDPGGFGPQTQPLTPELQPLTTHDEMAEALRDSRTGRIEWKSLPKPPLRSVNPRGVELPHPDVFVAKLPEGGNIRVWERRTPDVSAGAMVRRILGSGNEENWVTTIGVEVHDSEGMLTYRLTGLRGQSKFRDVVELFDQAARQQAPPPAPRPVPAPAQVASRPSTPVPAPPVPAPPLPAEPEPPVPSPVQAAPLPQTEIYTQLEAIPAMPMPMPPPPVTNMEPSYWQQERAELIEELAMWRRECMAARVALDEMRKLINGTRPKSGSRLFKRDGKEPPLTRTY